jgi:hypothetical protein
MRNWRSLWDELETWVGVLLGVGALLLLYVTLTAQAAGSVP